MSPFLADSKVRFGEQRRGEQLTSGIPPAHAARPSMKAALGMGDFGEGRKQRESGVGFTARPALGLGARGFLDLLHLSN